MSNPRDPETPRAMDKEWFDETPRERSEIGAMPSDEALKIIAHQIVSGKCQHVSLEWARARECEGCIAEIIDRHMQKRTRVICDTHGACAAGGSVYYTDECPGCLRALLVEAAEMIAELVSSTVMTEDPIRESASALVARLRKAAEEMK